MYKIHCWTLILEWWGAVFRLQKEHKSLRIQLSYAILGADSLLFKSCSLPIESMLLPGWKHEPQTGSVFIRFNIYVSTVKVCLKPFHRFSMHLSVSEPLYYVIYARREEIIASIKRFALLQFWYILSRREKWCIQASLYKAVQDHELYKHASKFPFPSKHCKIPQPDWVSRGDPCNYLDMGSGRSQYY